MSLSDLIGSEKKIPTIAIVGPTNVGKSTLFNRLTQTRKAIVCDRPGVTVDRHELTVENIQIGKIKIIDTGGVGPEALSHPLGKEIERAATQAVDEADLILFVVDGTREAGVEEFEISSWLRRQPHIDNREVWILCNKSDSKKHDESSYFMLGFNRVMGVSAEHNEGIENFWDQVHEFLKVDSSTLKEKPIAEEKLPGIIVLGRPNVGKSTLLNTILGKERHVVSEIAGTTRDTIESAYKHKGQIWRLCDTAGLRRPGRLERGVEWVAREKLKEVARDAEIAIILMDSTEGVTDLDVAIAGMALDFGLSVIAVFNKWDKMRGSEKAEDFVTKLERTADLKMDFMSWCPTLQVSGLTGKGVSELLKTIGRVMESRSTRVQTSKLNEIFERKLRLHSHPIGPRGKAAKFYYLAQVKTEPPEFVLFSNLPSSAVHFSYKRFISNTLRKEFGFEGTPIKLHFKTARN